MKDDLALFPELEDSARIGVHLLGLRVVTYCAGFGASVVIGRAVGPEGRGMYALPMVVLAIVVSLGNLGLEHAQIFLAGRKFKLNALWANAGLVGCAVAVGVWILGVVVIPAFGERPGGVPAAWLWIALIQVPLLLQILYWTNLLQLAGHARGAVGVTLLGTVAQTGVVLLLFALGDLTPFSVLLLTGMTTLITWGGTVMIGARAGLVSWRIDPSALRMGISFGLRAQLGIVFVFLLLRVDQLMVQRVLGFEALGLYSLAATLAELLWLLSDPFATALLRHQVEADGDEDVTLGYATARLGLFLTGSAAIVAWVVIPWAIRVTYGEAFMGAVWPFRLLLPGIVALAVQRPLAAILLKRGRPGLVSAFGAIALALNVGLNLWLLERIGPSAASLSSSSAYIILAAAYVIATGGSVRALLPTAR